MSVYFEFAEVLDFTAGAVGEPGQRTFYLQASDDERVVAVKCEKQQVAAIAQYLRRILADLEPAPGPTSVTASTISEPLVAAFTLGSIGLGFDPDSDQFVVQLDELVPGDLDDDAQDEDDEEPGTPHAGGATSGEAEVDRGRCACGSPRLKHWRSANVRSRWSPPGDPDASSAGCRSTPTATTARG